MKVTKAADAHVNIIDVPTSYYNICDIFDTDIFNTKFLIEMVHLISLCLYILVQNFISSYLSAQKILIQSLKLDMMHIIRHVKNLISFLEVVLRRLKNQLNSTCITFIVFDMNLHVVKCLQQPLNSVKFILLLVSSKYGAKNKGASIT